MGLPLKRVAIRCGVAKCLHLLGMYGRTGALRHAAHAENPYFTSKCRDIRHISQIKRELWIAYHFSFVATHNRASILLRGHVGCLGFRDFL